MVCFDNVLSRFLKWFSPLSSKFPPTQYQIGKIRWKTEFYDFYRSEKYTSSFLCTFFIHLSEKNKSIQITFKNYQPKTNFGSNTGMNETFGPVVLATFKKKKLYTIAKKYINLYIFEKTHLALNNQLLPRSTQTLKIL